MSRAVPTFPYAYGYLFPIDKMRHWIELQGESNFTVQQARDATGLNANSYLLRLRNRGEVEHVDHATYRRASGLWLVDFEQTRKHHEQFASKMNDFLDAAIGTKFRLLAGRLYEESCKLSSVEVRRCAHELEKLCDEVFDS